MRDRVTHAPHLAVAAFLERQFENRLRALSRRHHACDADSGRQRALAVEIDAAAETREIPFVRYAGDLCFVCPLEFVTRMRDLLGERAVVRQDDQSLRIEVESANRKEVARDTCAGDEIDHRLTPLRIRSCTDDTPWLIHQEMPANRRGLEPAAIHTNVVCFRIRFRAECRDGLAVDFDSALRDQDFSRSPRCDADLRKQLVEANLPAVCLPAVALAKAGSSMFEV